MDLGKDPMASPASPSPRRPRPWRRIVLVVALVGAGLGATALYGIGGRPGNPGACPGSAALAARLSPLAAGDLAAVAVEADPQPAPDLLFRKPDGQPARLADFRGRTVLVNLWATWCIPCREEMPALDRLQVASGSPAFAVVPVNIDQRAVERADAFLDEIGVKSLTRYRDPSARVFQALKTAGKAFGMPTSILVDPQGCLVASLAGPVDWAGEQARAFVLAASTRRL